MAVTMVSYAKGRWRLRIIENRCRGEFLGTKCMRMGNGEGFTMRNLIVFTVHLIRLV